MNNVNISLNRTIITLLKDVVPKKGYNNVSEYVRDLLRRDLRLEEAHEYPYDREFLAELEKEAKADLKKGRIKALKSMRGLLK